MSTADSRLQIERIGDVTIVRFGDKKIIDEANIAQIGSQLFSLVDEDRCRKLVLNFADVEYLSSAMLGKLITLDKKVKAAGGKLRFCAIRKPDPYEVFKITGLHKHFDIKDEEEAALDGF